MNLSSIKTTANNRNKNKNKNYKNNKMQGFSVVELLVVVAIVAILMAVALPDFLKATRIMQVNHQAKEMANAIKLAQSEAARLRQTVVMCRSDVAQTGCFTGSPTANWSVGWIIFVDNDGNGTRNDSSTNLEPLISIKQPLSTNYIAVAATGGPIANQIVFNGAGENAGTLNSVGTITFSYLNDRSSEHSYLIINRVGRVQVLNDAECMKAGSGCP